MCHKLDVRFFQELNGMDPDDVCGRALCGFDRDRRCYQLEAWGDEYEIYTERAEIIPVSKEVPPVNVECGLVILFYLLRAQDKPIRGEWISEKDIPGGVTFFTGPHAVPTHLIEERFGDCIEDFKRVCENLSGKPLQMADAAYEFRVLPRVPVAVLLWFADEEFEAKAKILFDRTIIEQLPMDVIFGLLLELCSRISSS